VYRYVDISIEILELYYVVCKMYKVDVRDEILVLREEVKCEHF